MLKESISNAKEFIKTLLLEDSCLPQNLLYNAKLLYMWYLNKGCGSQSKLDLGFKDSVASFVKNLLDPKKQVAIQ